MERLLGQHVTDYEVVAGAGGAPNLHRNGSFVQLGLTLGLRRLPSFLPKNHAEIEQKARKRQDVDIVLHESVDARVAALGKQLLFSGQMEQDRVEN